MSTSALILVEKEKEYMGLYSYSDGYPFEVYGLMYKICKLKDFVSHNELIYYKNDIEKVCASLIIIGRGRNDNPSILPTKFTPDEFAKNNIYEYKYLITIDKHDIRIRFNDTKHRDLLEWNDITKTVKEYISTNENYSLLPKGAIDNGPCNECLVRSTCISYDNFYDIFNVREQCSHVTNYKKEYRKKIKRKIPKDLLNHIKM